MANIIKLILAISLVGGVLLTGSTTGAKAGEKKCCKQKNTHTIRVPGYQIQGPNINISTTTTNINKGGNNNQVNNQGYFFQNQFNGRSLFFGGGGGGVIGGGPIPTVIDNLLIEGEMQSKLITEQIEVPYTEAITRSRWTEHLYVLQAVCMDDSNTPHPSSRTDPSEQVDPNFSGELFRCMAGTWMQVTLGIYENGGGQFNNGTTIACAKGEALFHQAGGKLSCAAQTPRRSCNERSLLRKFGAGIKIVRISREEQYTEQITKTRIETRTRQVGSSSSSSSKTRRTLVLSGGVGGG
ncbi:MAG: hypothetical protein COA60_009735 [Robiginitomaculum sp.]|nr:hypothetical protein [Robiginitomaculum sp.]